MSEIEWRLRLTASHNVSEILPLIAFFNERAVGIAVGAIHALNSSIAHIYQMWVAPENSGKGVTKRLMSAIIEWAKQLNLRVLTLDVAASQIEAVNLYKNLGFQTSESQAAKAISASGTINPTMTITMQLNIN